MYNVETYINRVKQNFIQQKDLNLNNLTLCGKTNRNKLTDLLFNKFVEKIIIDFRKLSTFITRLSTDC